MENQDLIRPVVFSPEPTKKVKFKSLAQVNRDYKRAKKKKLRTQKQSRKTNRKNK